MEMFLCCYEEACFLKSSNCWDSVLEGPSTGCLELPPGLVQGSLRLCFGPARPHPMGDLILARGVGISLKQKKTKQTFLEEYRLSYTF